MLDAITAARSTINFETYIYWSGEIGLTFAEALAERSRSGVEVRLLVDWAGSIPFDQKLIDLMTGAGVSFHRYRPIRWYTLDRVNNRTHRKLLIVDGKRRLHRRRRHRRQVARQCAQPGRMARHALPHRRSGGRFPAVGLQRKLAGDDRRGDPGQTSSSPTLEPAGDVPAQVVLSSQPEGSRTLHQLMLLGHLGRRKPYPDRHGLFRARRRHAAAADRGAQARRGDRHHRARTAIPTCRWSGTAPAISGASCWSRRPDPRIPADHVPPEAADRRPRPG